MCSGLGSICYPVRDLTPLEPKPCQQPADVFPLLTRHILQGAPRAALPAWRCQLHCSGAAHGGWGLLLAGGMQKIPKIPEEAEQSWDLTWAAPGAACCSSGMDKPAQTPPDFCLGELWKGRGEGAATAPSPALPASSRKTPGISALS